MLALVRFLKLKIIMENKTKGDVLNVNTLSGVKKIIFSHYSDKYNKRFWATNGLEYNCKDVI